MKIVEPKPFYFKNSTKAVLLLHSFSGSPNDMRLLGRFLERNEYSAYAPIFAGHGTFEPNDIFEQGSPDIWYRQTVEAIEFLESEGMAEISVFGLSLGSIFATKILEENNRVKLGGVFGTPLGSRDFSNIRQGFFQYSRKVYEINNQADIDEKLDLLTTNLDKMIASIASYTEDVEDKISQIRKPYFIGQGTYDKLVNPELAVSMGKKVPNAEIHLYDAGHVLTVNDAHKQLEIDLLNFLENN
ncbi:alpha/beta hydrolase [Lactobacillus terrae]|uniref:alpha/beta hydrolase n=1 Tax=Lactobacillus terrae TaxID=2269374 RepID=UPI000C1B7509|nr:carboxylesterase [Lactobacillus terrae]